jgi:REP element-mobilizing transposase RayT
MAYNPAIHHRSSIRLKGYDYAQVGAYFVTIVTRGRECLFGDIINNEMQLNDAGRMIQSEWEALPKRFPGIELDEYGIMPNHFHGVVVNMVGATLVVAQGVTTNGDDVDNVGATLVVAQGVTTNGDDVDNVGATLVVSQGVTTNGDDVDNVGATLVVAQGVMDDGNRAGINPAPTAIGDGVNMVGATLVVAQGVMDDGNRAGINPAHTLGDIIGAFKSITTHEYIRGVHESGWPPFDKRIWKRNYFEHIIRNERELDRIREYIVNNPLKWILDTEHPNAKR